MLDAPAGLRLNPWETSLTLLMHVDPINTSRFFHFAPGTPTAPMPQPETSALSEQSGYWGMSSARDLAAHRGQPYALVWQQSVSMVRINSDRSLKGPLHGDLDIHCVQRVCLINLQGHSVTFSTLQEDNDVWVTVFGFQPSQLPIILRDFAKCGDIVQYGNGREDNANWVHIKYSVRILPQALALCHIMQDTTCS